MKEYNTPKSETVEIKVNSSILQSSGGMGEGGEI